MTLSFGLTNGNTGLLYSTLFQNSSNITGWICDDGFDDVGASAICNFMHGSYLFFEESQLLTDQYDILASDFSCSGTENLSQCTWTYQHSCDLGEGIFLDCGGVLGPISFGLTEVDHGLLYASINNQTGQKETGWVCDD